MKDLSLLTLELTYKYTRRLSYQNDPEIWQLTLGHCKKEFLSLLGFAISIVLNIGFAFASIIFFQVNEYRLPLKVFIVWLPFNDISRNWFLNFFYQLSMALMAAGLLVAYIPLIMFLINHSCLGLDVSIKLAEKIRATSKELNMNEISDDKIAAKKARKSRIEKSITNQIEKLVETSYTFMERHAETQDLLKFNFFLEFSVLSTIFCCCLFTISADYRATVMAYLAMFLFVPQLFIYCWLGNRVISRVEKLAATVYDIRWYAMKVEHRKDILKILLMAQNMQGFNGIFHDVSMETLQKV